MRKHILPVAAATVAFLAVFSATAHAAAAVAPADGTVLDLLQPVLAAFTSGNYLLCGSLAVVLAVAAVRRYLAPRYAFLDTDLGSACLVLFGSLGATMAASAATSTTFHWDMLWNATKIAFAAAGGYAVVRALIIVPYLTKLADKGPKWLHAPMAILLAIFQKQLPTPAPETTRAPTVS